jgi:hypothetical protein
MTEMRMQKMMLACTALPLVAAFENETGWKMDGDKIATDANGDPIYIGADGKEQSIAHDAIARRNAEAKQHRERAERAEADLAKYKGPDGKMLDPATAFKAVETVANIDAKKLIDAGEVDKVKEDIKRQFEQQLSEKDTALTAAQQRIDAMLVDSVFKGSEFITERVAMPRDFFEAAMRNNFKVEDGKVVAYDRSGNRLMSKKVPGEYADANEALELLVEMHPQKDTILKAPEGGGTGGGGGGGNRGTGRRMSRADFEKLPAHQQRDAAEAMGKGELTITD